MAKKKIFISYSHDSIEHERWVEKLATSLEEHEIDVILDKWHLGLGEELSFFMERSIKSADRVLVICTDEYIKKSNNVLGGVGYEKGIMAAHLISNQKTNKFIPVIKDVKNRKKLPEFLHNRFFVDLSDASNFDSHMQWIANEIKGIPRKGLTTKRPIKIYAAEMYADRTEAIRKFEELLPNPDSHLIAIENDDIFAVAKGDIVATAGVSVGSSGNSADVAANSLLICFKMSSIDIAKAKGFLLGITGNSNMTMDDFNTINRIIHDNLHEDTNIILGVFIDENVSGIKLDSLVSL